MSDYGIPGIGYGLGTYGLGGSSAYYDPTMMMGYDAYSSYCMPGMLGMYNPAFMQSMAQTYQNIDKMNLTHSSAMHQIQLDQKVEARKAHDKAAFEESMVDSDIRGLIETMEQKILEGDQEGLCLEYNKLERAIAKKYSDYFKAHPNENPTAKIRTYIEELYASIISQKRREQGVNLRDDIKKYGQTAFEHGFWKRFHGKDHPDKYTDETLSYIYRTNIPNKSSKERMENLGAITEGVAEVGVVGLTARGIARLFTKSKTIGWLSALGVAVADFMWQQARA